MTTTPQKETHPYHPPMLRWLERVNVAIEGPLRRLDVNPLQHTGTISVFLLVIIIVTGVYLTMFYQFGFTVSYESVAAIEESFIGRIIRALHRYASGAVVFTTLLHGWRMLFQDRFRGPRWVAWVSGIVMAAVLWAIGVTGYWLIADARADVLTSGLIDLMSRSAWGVDRLFDLFFTTGRTGGWVFMVIIITLHIGGTVALGGLYWLHIKRLSRPKHMPPTHWMIIVGVAMVLLAMIIPVGMLPADPPVNRLSLDVLYLFFLPAPRLLIGWAGLSLALAALPVVFKRPPPVQLDTEACTGSTLCARDCPYDAIEMVERTDGKRHKFVAQIDESLCVGCGVCVGSCTPRALSIPTFPTEPLWNLGDVNGQRVVFACERQVRGAKLPDDVRMVPVSCAGQVHPHMLADALEAGATHTDVVGCGPEDCVNREGNLWADRRIERERLPKLRRHVDRTAIDTAWVPPAAARDAITEGVSAPQATEYGMNQFRWHHFIPAGGLLLVMIVVQMLLGHVPFTPQGEATLQLMMVHESGAPIAGVESSLEPEPGLDVPSRLRWVVNGEVVFEEEIGERTFERINLPPGEYNVLLLLFDREDPGLGQVLINERVQVGAGQTITYEFEDARLGGDAAAGRRLFMDQVPGRNTSCRICHSLEPNERLVGPSLYGIADRAADRVPGLTAEEYLRQSILQPDAYVVEGYPEGQMLATFGESLSEEELNDLIAYLMTLEEE